MKRTLLILLVLGVLCLAPSVSALFISASWGSYYPYYYPYPSYRAYYPSSYIVSYPPVYYYSSNVHYTYPAKTSYTTNSYTTNTHSTTSVSTPSKPAPYCGDYICNGEETKYNCAKDCGVPEYCGDGTCDAGETKYTCSRDCGVPSYCGDGTCDKDETRYSCPNDCGVPDYCGDGLCNGAETKQSCAKDCGLAPYCGDGTCDKDETKYNCALDCGLPAYCGDGKCNGIETPYSCSLDCGEPRCSDPSGRDGETVCRDKSILLCDSGSWEFRKPVECCTDYDCDSSQRCSANICVDRSRTLVQTTIVKPQYYCGDGLCNNGESPYSCPLDCGLPAVCGDGVCNGLETQDTCPDDCGYPPVYGVALSKSDDCIEVIQGESGEILLGVANTGNRDETYSLSILGPTATWVQTSPLSLKVAAGETKTWLVRVLAPEGVEPGLYNLTLRAESQFASSEALCYVDVRLPPIEGGFEVLPSDESSGTGSEENLTPTATGAAVSGTLIADPWFLSGMGLFLLALTFIAFYFLNGRRAAPETKEDLEKRLLDIVENIDAVSADAVPDEDEAKPDVGELTPDGEPTRNDLLSRLAYETPSTASEKTPGELYWEDRIKD